MKTKATLTALAFCAFAMFQEAPPAAAASCELTVKYTCVPL